MKHNPNLPIWQHDHFGDGDKKDDTFNEEMFPRHHSAYSQIMIGMFNPLQNA